MRRVLGAMGQNSAKLKRLEGPRRVLILGCEEAGKTCLVQQIKHHSGFTFSDTELSSYRKYIRRCMIKTVQAAARKVDKNLLRLKAPEKFKYYRIISEYEHTESMVPQMVLESIEKITQCTLFWDAYKDLEEKFPLDFYTDKLRIIFGTTYDPSLDEILNCYKPTKDMQETSLGLDMDLKIIEIAGSRYARRRWIQTLEKFDTILFVASSLDYEYGPAFEESVTFFETICNSRLFSHCKIHLVFTKIDLLREELASKKIDYRTTLDDLCHKYFEVAERTTPFYEVNFLSEKSSSVLIKSLFNV